MEKYWACVEPARAKRARVGRESSLMMVAGRERSRQEPLGDREFVCRVDRVCLNTRSPLVV